MAQNELSGPKLGQWVIYTAYGTFFYPAIIIAKSASGLVELIGFPPGQQPVDQQNVEFDPTGSTSGSWRYSFGIESGQTTSFPSNFYVTESGAEYYVTESGVPYVTETP